jgi:hypothetical protein
MSGSSKKKKTRQKANTKMIRGKVRDVRGWFSRKKGIGI